MHLATGLTAIGGHTRMLTHWVRNDPANRHSLVLTRQFEPVPEAVRDAIDAAGGEVTQLNLLAGTILTWAGELQKCMAEADVVVMHVHSMDVIPFLACAGMAAPPPVIFVNHSDHLFWLGVRAVDLVLSTRLSGNALCSHGAGSRPSRRR